MKGFSGLRACLTVEEPDSLTWPVFSMLGLQEGKQSREEKIAHRNTEQVKRWTYSTQSEIFSTHHQQYCAQVHDKTRRQNRSEMLENRSTFLFLSCSQDILVAGKPPFQQSKSTLSATLNGTTQAISQWWTHCQVATLCQRQAGNKTVDL